MKSINSENDLLKSIMKLIARQFGDKCEIVLHDWSEGYDKSIVAIENGHVSGRKVGDPGSNLGLEVMRGSSDGTSQYNYVTRTKDGKTLRSSSLYLTNDEGEKIGALCINFDISDILTAQKTLGYLSMIEQGQEEKFVNDVSELLETSVYKGYKQDKIEMRGDRAEMSDFPLYLNTVAGGLDRRDQTIGGFSFVVKIYAVPVVEIIGQLLYLLGRYGFNTQFGDCL